MSSVDGGLDVVGRWYAALEADDMESALAICADRAEIRYPRRGLLAYGGLWRGRDGIAQWAEAHDQAEEILEFRVDETIAQGSRVVTVGYFRGRARDTGREWETGFVHVLRVHEGRLQELEAYFDTAAAVEAHRARDRLEYSPGES